jgi:hypothetical protein
MNNTGKRYMAKYPWLEVAEEDEPLFPDVATAI